MDPTATAFSSASRASAYLSCFIRTMPITRFAVASEPDRASALCAWSSAGCNSPRPSSASASAAIASTLSGARLRARSRGGLASG